MKYNFSFQYPDDAVLKELHNPSADQFQVSIKNTQLDLWLDIMLMKPDYAMYCTI